MRLEVSKRNAKCKDIPAGWESVGLTQVHRRMRILVPVPSVTGVVSGDEGQNDDRLEVRDMLVGGTSGDRAGVVGNISVGEKEYGRAPYAVRYRD